MVNVVHPHPTTWEKVLADINEELGGRIPHVPMEEWVSKLNSVSTDASNDDLQRIVSLDEIVTRSITVLKRVSACAQASAIFPQYGEEAETTPGGSCW